MRYAIISDIHSNLEALQAVLKDCLNQDVDTIVCAGDIVGYGANPKECLSVLNELKTLCIAGNHDWAVSGRLDASYFLDEGKAAISWTRTKLSLEEVTALNNLKLTYDHKDFLMVHGSPDLPESFSYLKNEEKAAKAFEAFKQPICFVGHTHVPEIYVKQGDSVARASITEIELDLNYSYIVNVGSVGQPRDGNPKASYGLYDTKVQKVQIRRVAYDIESAQQKIIEAGLPEMLATRLTSGR